MTDKNQTEVEEFDIEALIALAAEQGKDLNEVESGGGEYVPPAEGLARVRFIGYVELGAHTQKGQKGAPDKDRPMAQFTFELHGAKWPYKETESGEKYAEKITFSLPISRNEKAHYIKVFNMLNYAKDAKIFPQLLGRGFLANVVHDTWTNQQGKPVLSAKLRNDAGFTFRAPTIEDVETNEVKTVAVPAALAPIQVFLWDYANKPMWDKLFIAGEYEARTNEAGEVISPARSKNRLQEKIRAAKNFKGSPLETVLFGDVGIDEAEQPERTAEDKQAVVESKAGASADPLAGL